jgi:Ca2+-binding RTX toxin-like protein
MKESPMMLEQLEIRQHLSVSLSNGVLTINGTSGADRVDLSLSSGKLIVKENGVTKASPYQSSLKSVVINFGAGNDRLTTYYGVRGLTVNGGDGDDYILGSWNSDVIDAGNGNDYVHARPSSDVVKGGAGNDTLIGCLGNDSIWGGDGNDLMVGAAGDDNLFGENGDDNLFGVDGNDNLDGGIGYNTANGGNGNDDFRNVAKIWDLSSSDNGSNSNSAFGF